MEYIISTREFVGSIKKKDLYFSKEIRLGDKEVSFLDGDLYKGSIKKYDSIEKILASEQIGCFNYFRYLIDANELHIKNDKFGTNPLFIYFVKGVLIISNNVWQIIKILKKEEIHLSKEYFKFTIGSWGVNMDGETLFKDIVEVNPGYNICWKKDLGTITYKKYYDYKHIKKNFLSVKESVELLDSDLNFTFQRMKELNPNKVMGFGNSGGLDSRLVPIYAKQNDIKSIGITIVDKKPKGLLDSITALNAGKIARIYDIPNVYIEPLKVNFENRMLLDIRNNTFGTSEIFKNPYDKVPKFDYYVTGGNGFIVGGGWEKLIKMENKKDFAEAFVNYHSKLNAYSWHPGDSNLINKFFSTDDLRKINGSKVRFFEENYDGCNLSVIRGFHQFSMNRRSPSGGFESINRLYPTFNIYYPLVFENTLFWDPNYFANRIVLKELIKKKSSLLYKIPSQRYGRLDGRELSLKEKVTRKLALKFRDEGLEYFKWVQNKVFLDYANSIFQRKNDLYFDMLGVSQVDFLKLNILESVHPHVSLDFLKIKKMFDIIEYQEFGFVDNNEFMSK